MSTDVRKHTVPDEGVAPARAAFDELSLSLRDAIPVATVTERTQLVADLTAAGQGPTTTRPLLVVRADAGACREYEFTLNGTSWRVIPMVTPWVTLPLAAGWQWYQNDSGYAAAWRRNGDTAEVRPGIARRTGSALGVLAGVATVLTTAVAAPATGQTGQRSAGTIALGAGSLAVASLWPDVAGAIYFVPGASGTLTIDTTNAYVAIPPMKWTIA